MTRADDLRAALVQKVNSYILDNLDPELADEEDEAIHEAGDIVDLVLQAAYERTMADLAEMHEAIRQTAFAARHADGRLAYEPEPTEQTWWETWPATAAVHAQERHADARPTTTEVIRQATFAALQGHRADGEPPDDAPPICVCSSDDLYCEVHDA